MWASWTIQPLPLPYDYIFDFMKTHEGELVGVEWQHAAPLQSLHGHLQQRLKQG